jgi:hypothetical protein
VPDNVVVHTIPVPVGMDIEEAFDRICRANEEDRPAWPEDTDLDGWANVIVHPDGTCEVDVP